MVQGRLSPRQLIQIQTCLCTPLQQFSALRLDSDCCDQQQKEDTVPRPGPPCHAGTGPRHWRHCSARHGLSRCAALHLLVLAIRLSPDIVDDVPARRFRLFFFGPCGPCPSLQIAVVRVLLSRTTSDEGRPASKAATRLARVPGVQSCDEAFACHPDGVLDTARWPVRAFLGTK